MRAMTRSGMNFFRTIIALFMIGFLTTSVIGQKFGYVNSGNLLESLPEVKAADAEMVTFRDQLSKEGQDALASLEVKYSEYITKVQSGELSRIQQEEMEAELKKEQEAIAKMEQEGSIKIAQKREELLAPILERADEMIQKLGKDEGYTMIFDSSVGALLYAVEAEDLTEKVRQMMVSQ